MNIIRTYYPSWQLQHSQGRYVPAKLTDIRKTFDLQKPQAVKSRGKPLMCKVWGGWDAGSALELLTIRGQGPEPQSLRRGDFSSVPSVSHRP